MNCFTILENPAFLTMAKKPNSDDDNKDSELFRHLMDEVRPLTQDKISPYRQKMPARPIKHPADETPSHKDMMSDPLAMDKIETTDKLLFNRPGVQANTLRKLRRGQLTIEAELDLHRMTSDEARQTIIQFLPQMVQLGKRCVRIIHGKGYGSLNKTPVLKNKLNHWLRQRDEVLAFCSARPADGGTGAIYLLLKRPKK